MKLEKSKVEHIAKLARIEITEEEKEKYSEELTTILNFVEKLNEVETENIEPTYQVIGRINSFRNDESMKHGKEEGLVRAAPGHDKKYIKVKAVLN